MPNTAPTKAQRVLEFIKANPNGRTLKEIQCFVLDMNGRQKWLDKGYLQYNTKTGELERAHAGRGYWCDYLYGLHSMFKRPGLLMRYCTKLPTGRWIVTEKIEGPFRRMDVNTKSYIANVDRIRGAQQRAYEALPQCENCGHGISKYSARSPDGKAHINQCSGAYHADCMNRVWRRESLAYDAKATQLTKITRDEVRMAEKMAAKIHTNYQRIVQAVWDVLGENLA